MHQSQGLAYGRQHTQGKDINFQQPQCFDIFLVPLDDGSVFHAGIFNRDKV